MDSVRQLLIRACKARNPNLRVRQVYRRFYGKLPLEQETFCLSGILSTICDEHLEVKVASLITDLSPNNRWKFGIEDDESYLSGVVKVLTSNIRLAERDRFPGLQAPALFRNAQKEGSLA